MKSDKETLLGKYISGNASSEEEKEIIEWLKQDPAHEEELERAKHIWNLSFNLKKNNLNDPEKAWEDFKLLARSEPATQKGKDKFLSLKIAAAVALLLVSFVLIKFFVFNPATEKSFEKAEKQFIENKKNVPISMVTVSTTDSAKIFFLPDSSCIHLNKESKLIYPEKFDGMDRLTSLTGEAFFEVKHTGAPFAVICKQTKTVVLGTSFNIKGYEKDKKVVVSVVTGTVQLSDMDSTKADKITLKANERGTFDDDKASISKTQYSDEGFAWWKKIKLKTKIKKFIRNLKHKLN